jgi:hypothetical protein
MKSQLKKEGIISGKDNKKYWLPLFFITALSVVVYVTVFNYTSKQVAIKSNTNSIKAVIKGNNSTLNSSTTQGGTKTSDATINSSQNLSRIPAPISAAVLKRSSNTSTNSIRSTSNHPIKNNNLEIPIRSQPVAKTDKLKDKAEVVPANTNIKTTEGPVEQVNAPKMEIANNSNIEQLDILQLTLNEPARQLWSQPDLKFPSGATAKKFKLGINYSFDFTKYFVEQNKSVASEDAEYAASSDSIKGIKQGAQFTIGVSGAYSITPHLEVELEIAYSQKEKLSDVIQTPIINNQYSVFKYFYNGKYFEFGGKLKYLIPATNRIALYPTIGGMASFNFPTNATDKGYYIRKTFTDTLTHTDKILLETSSASLSFLVGLEINYQLSSRWSAFIEPLYKYGINPVIKHPTYDYIPVNHYWRTVSIGAGIKYSF